MFGLEDELYDKLATLRQFTEQLPSGHLVTQAFDLKCQLDGLTEHVRLALYTYNQHIADPFDQPHHDLFKARMADLTQSIGYKHVPPPTPAERAERERLVQQTIATSTSQTAYAIEQLLKHAKEQP